MLSLYFSLERVEGGPSVTVTALVLPFGIVAVCVRALVEANAFMKNDIRKE